MQMLFHIPDAIAERFKLAIPARQRSAYVARLMENSLPEETEDPLYKVALAVEEDAALNEEMKEWREGVIGDGIRGTAYASGAPNAEG